MDGVVGVVPGLGLPIRRYALWQGTARGISLERLLHGGLPPTALLDLLHNRWAEPLICVTPYARTAVAGRYPFTCAFTPQVTFLLPLQHSPIHQATDIRALCAVAAVTLLVFAG